MLPNYNKEQQQATSPKVQALPLFGYCSELEGAMGKRAGSEAAIRLLACGKPEEWNEALNDYNRCVQRLSQEKGRAGLVELDRWWREELPSAIRGRGEKPYVTKEELVKVVQWKLWMGVVRPNLLRFASETKPTEVENNSREAFAFLPRPPTDGSAPTIVSTDASKKAIVALVSHLKGVGPATASAVLAAGCGGCPFDADEVIDAVMTTGVRKYTVQEYLKVQETLTLKASQLGRAWDAERVRKALWSSAMRFRFTLFAGEDAPATKSNSTTVGRRGSASSKTTSKAVEPKTSSTKITKPVAEEAAPTTSEKQGAVAVSDKSRKRKGSAKGTGDTTGRGSRKSGDERKSAEASGTGVTEERRKSRRS